MAIFDVKPACIKCNSSNIIIPSDNKTADTMIKCKDCNHSVKWREIQTFAIIKAKRQASTFLKKNLDKIQS